MFPDEDSSVLQRILLEQCDGDLDKCIEAVLSGAASNDEQSKASAPDDGLADKEGSGSPDKPDADAAAKGDVDK